MPEIDLRMKDDGGNITVSLGDKLIIHLEQLGGAGYDWEKEGFDSKFFQETSPEDAAFKSKDIGGGGDRIFIFQPLKKGTAEIRLKHRRPWDKGSTINEFAVTIHVT